MMFSWMLTPLGHWLSFAGALVATLGVAWLKGRAAGKAAWEAKRRAARDKARQQSSEIRHDIQNDSDAALDRVSIAGCATDPLTHSDCDWTQPIKPSRKDVLTRQTKEQIAAHNEVGAKICGWRP